MPDEDLTCECTIEWVGRAIVDALLLAVCLLAVGAAILS